MIDWLITDALIVDGTGAPAFRGNLAIEREKIVAVGQVQDRDARHRIEAQGKVLCPGFVDMHSHSDVLFLNGSPLDHKILQGVTTELIGQDGMSLAPLTDSSLPYMVEMIEPLAGHLEGKWQPWDLNSSFQVLGERRPRLNVATLVGHCNLRLAVMGHRMEAASPIELRQMGEWLTTALRQGAVGLSLGLIYPPSSYSNTEELISLGRVVKDHDAIIVVHMRNEQEKLFEALEEMITVGRESGCKIHISHLKSLGKTQWGKMDQVLGMFDRAIEQGVNISFDQYPYDAGCTSLSVLLPGWAVAGGWDEFDRRLKDAETRQKILSALRSSIESRGGPAAITLVSLETPENQALAGKNLEEISSGKGLSPEDTALEILEKERTKAVAIYHSISEGDVECAMRHILHTVGSDGILGAFPHPRAYGTFPRIIHHFCRRRKLFSLEEAIRRMTAAPAKRLGLEKRGQIVSGFYADLLLFDPERFKDLATYENPKQLASGLDWMLVNGEPVLSEGRIQETGVGKVLRRK